MDFVALDEADRLMSMFRGVMERILKPLKDRSDHPPPRISIDSYTGQGFRLLVIVVGKFSQVAAFLPVRWRSSTPVRV